MRSNDFFFNFFYSSFNAEFCEDFRHGNNSSVTLKSPSLPKFKNINYPSNNTGPNWPGELIRLDPCIDMGLAC